MAKIVAYTIEPNNKGLQITGSSAKGSTTEVIDSLELALEALTLPYGEPVLRVCWNLDTTLAPLLKLLGENICRKLYRTNKGFYRPYSMFYIPEKVFSIKRIPNKEKVNFYHLEQYYPDHNEPASAQGTAQLGEKLLIVLNKMGLYPAKLTSPVAMWEQYVMNHLSLPTVWDVPKEAAEFAWKCSGKLWIEAYQIGYWE